MSDPTATPARPVSLVTIFFLLAVFAAFLLVIRWFYHPAPASAFNAQAENISTEKDLAWKADAAARRNTLRDVRAAEAKKASGYAWIDQKAGVVQLPIERAMELTAQKYGATQQIRQIRDLPTERGGNR